jgi:hypothetical protein
VAVDAPGGGYAEVWLNVGRFSLGSIGALCAYIMRSDLARGFIEGYCNCNCSTITSIEYHEVSKW